jgi:hypothetical protein
MKKPSRICTLDMETDPFAWGVVPEPFAIGFNDGEQYYEWWGDDCVIEFARWLASYPEPCMIYAHNGGKFDFLYLFEYLEEDLFIINGRIVKGKIGIHELRDSYAILPMPLRAYNKETIDYSKMERHCRQEHMVEILTYLESDCKYLLDLVVAFHDEFGDKLTVGSASNEQLRRFHEYECMSESGDAEYRSYYFGGRNQCFKSGMVRGDYQIYDVNSMYPFVMKTAMHPVSCAVNRSRDLNLKTDFAKIRAKNWGALPIRTKTGIDFTCEEGVFYATGHEIIAGLETGTLEIQEVLEAHSFTQRITFADFIDHFYEERLKAKKEGDKIHDIFYKFIMNSSYGKFAQNPENFKKSKLTCNLILDVPWELKETRGKFMFWEKPAPGGFRSYLNVATAASITGAARALLLRGLAKADDPVYCDTDSIICKALNAPISDTELGAWKCEGKGDVIHIAGKKMYVVFDDGTAHKQACKGVRLTAQQIVAVASGMEVEFANPVPKFGLLKEPRFTKRKIKATAKAKKFARD